MSVSPRSTFPLLVVLALVAAAVAAPAAFATFPGANGPIAVVVDPPSDPAGLTEANYPTNLLVQPGTITGSAPFKTFGVSWSADGAKIAYACRTLCIANADGTGVSHVKGARASDYSPVWSPDGTKLAFERFVSRRNTSQLWTVDLTTGTFTRLTNSPQSARSTTNDASPAWGPDGSIIIFTREYQKFNKAGIGTLDHTDLVGVQPTGGEVITLLKSRNNFNIYSPDWAPDGSKIAFTRQASLYGASGAFLLDTTTHTVTAVHIPKRASIGGLSFSPDGTMLAFESIAPNQPRGIICTETLATSALVCPKNKLPLTNPAWQPLPVTTPAG